MLRAALGRAGRRIRAVLLGDRNPGRGAMFQGWAVAVVGSQVRDVRGSLGYSFPSAQCHVTLAAENLACVSRELRIVYQYQELSALSFSPFPTPSP